MKNPTIKKIASIGLVLAAGVMGTRADALTWDPALTGGSGGNGTWNLNSTANWFNGASDVQWKDNSTTGTNSAIFSGSAGTVALNTSLSASNLQFTTSGYTLSGSGTLSLGAGGIDASALGSGTTTIGNALTLLGGQQLWQVGAGSTLAINGAVTRSSGVTVDFSTTGVTSSTITNINGIIGGWATTGNAISSATTGDWAATNGAGGVVTYTAYTSVTGAQTGAGASAQNWKNTGTTTLSASATINSIVAAFDIGPNIGVTTTIGSGGLILQGISRWIINNGGGNYSTGTIIPGTATGELFVHVANGDIIANTATANNWRIWPQIKDNGATPTILVKDGPGMVALMNTNTYTGGTIVNNGILLVNKSGSTTAALLSRNWSSLGFGTVTVNSPGIFEVGYANGTGTDFLVTNTFVLNGGKYLANDGTHRQTGPIVIGSRGATFGSTYDGGTKGLFLDGLISGSGPITLQQAYQAGVASAYNNPDGNAYNNSVVYFGNNANTYSGTVTVIPYSTGLGGGSYLAINGSTALQFATAYLDNNTSGHRYAASGGVFSPLVFNTGLGSATIGAISGPGNIILNGYNESTYALQADAIALTVGGNNASTTLSGVIVGTGSLTKTGNGALTLSGVNTYTGNTTINGGSLVLSGGFVNSTNITVATGATLDVSALGSITLNGTQVFTSGGTNIGSVSTTSGTKIYAGTDGGYGTNKFNNDLTLASGAVVYMDVGTLNNSTNDRITVAGTLTANNNVIHLKAPSGSSLQAADYILISSANPISGSFSGTAVWDVSPVNAGNFSIVTSGSTVTLKYSANSAPSGGGFATPSTVVRNQKTLLTVLTTNGVPGTVQTVVVDASSIGGSASFSLVRSNASNIFTNTVTVAASTTAGGKTLPATVTDSTPLNSIVNIALTVNAANDVWNGLGANDFFSSNLNWTNGTAPGLVGDSLQFAGTTRLTPSMDNNYTITSLLFDNTAGGFNIGTANSSTLTLAGNLTNNSTSAQTLNVPITLDTAQTVNAAAGNITIGGLISGLGSLSKTGNNTLTLSGGATLNGNVGITGGALNISGGSATFGTGFSYAGFRDTSGTLTLSGGSFTTGGDFGVGYSDLNGTAYNATGTVVVANANVALGGRLIVGRGNNNQNTVSGTVTLNSGGTLSSEGDVLLGFAGNNNLGKIVVNGGTLNVATTTTRWLILGQWDTALAQVDVNSGQVNINGNTAIRYAINGNTGSNVFNLNGGAVTFYSDNATTVGGSGVLDLHQGNGATVVNVFNLNGGTLTVPSVISANAAGTRIFNFNGGTLKATVNGTIFAAAVASAANVRNGGAIIDDGGFSTEIDQVLLHSTIAGDNATDGGLTKQGSGILTLTGANTYTGNTTISAGTLTLSGSSSVSSSPNVTIGAGATLDVSSISFTVGGSQTLFSSGFVNGSAATTAGSKIYGGTDGVYGTNTFNNDLTLVSGAVCYLDLGTAYNKTNDQIVVNGTLTANNNVIHLKAPNTLVNLDTTADYVLISSANAIAGTFASAPVWDVAPANAGHYTVVTSGNTVTLHYSAAVSSPTATGSANPSTLLRNQPTKVTVNVTPGSAAISSVTLDLSSIGGTSATLVRSNTSSLYTNTVIIPAAASAGSVTLTATATDINSLSGSASIPLTINVSSEVWNGGGGNQNWSTNPNWVSGFAPGLIGDSLVFAGTTGLAPNMDNSYTNTGLTFNSGAGSFNIGSTVGGTLTLTGPIANNSVNNQTVNVPIADLGGGVTKTGNGSVTLANNNTYTGNTTVNAGTLALTGSSTSTANFNVGNAAGNSILQVSGSGSITPNYMLLGNVSGAVGAVYQTGGNVAATVNTGFDNLSVGNVAGAYGYFGASGGSFSVNGICIGGEANTGSGASFGSPGGNGIMEVRAGASVIDSGWLVIARQNSGTVGPSIGELNVYGGSLTYAGGGIVGPWNTGLTAIINILGGSVANTAAEGVYLGNTGNTGILNLNGGLLKASVIAGYNGPTYAVVNYGQLNFNGGTLQASAASGDFIRVTTANIYSGGATIDNNGNAVTINQPLLAPTGSGVNGILSFTGGAGYIAPPIVIVTNGVGDTTGTGATAIAQINPVTGTVTGVVITCPGVNYTATPTFLVSGGGATTAATITGISPTANTSGGLTSVGSGTLTLSGANTYTGNTTINAGILEITQPVIATNSTVTIASGAKIQLDFAATVTNRVTSLVLNGVSQPNGVYNATTSPTFIAGTGNLQVAPAAVTPPTIAFTVTGGNTLSMSWSGYLGYTLQQQTNSLTKGLGTNWVDVPGSTSVTSTNITIDPSKPTVFYRLRP